jgi:IS4 transposase
MKTRFLFPHQFRVVGLICILAYIPAMVIKKIIHIGHNNYSPAEKLADATGLLNSEHIFIAIAIISLTGGLFLIAFSKEKVEDEQISQLRLDSLQWAIYLNYFILIITIIFTSNANSKNFAFFAFWVPLVFFIIRFRWKIYQLNRLLTKDENVA